MSERKGIPFVDLVAPHLQLEDELVGTIRDVLRSGMLVGGPVVEQFEQEFAQYCDARYCVGVSSGTDALRFALMAAGIGTGDAVVTVANTFAATVEAILQAGARPCFVDINPATFNMSVEGLRSFLQNECERSGTSPAPVHRSSGRPIKAIVPVHLYGQMCDMDPIMALAAEYGLSVIEDSCQAHGAQYFSARENAWRKAGSIGKAAAFSFYPAKNLGAGGEAGAITTNDEALATHVRMLRDHGQNKKYHHLLEGYNGRIDALQAAILRVKLPHLEDWNEKRRLAAQTYKQLLSDADCAVAPSEPSWSRAVYHLYVIRVQRRDELQNFMLRRRISTGLHYPIPLHQQKAFEHLGYHEGALPATEAAASEILSLPMYPQIEPSQQFQVVDSLKQFFSVRSIPLSLP